MRKVLCVVLIASAWFLMCSAYGAQPAEEGTTAEELSKLKLPLPADVKVGVLPLWDYASSVYQQRVGTAAVYLWLEHEGFQMVPILSGFKVQADDKELEPGYALRKSDALREGKSLGCDWVVYGEIKELRVYQKPSLFTSGKKIACSLRLAVLDCKSGEVIYWKSRKDALGDSGMIAKKSSKLIRVGLQAVSQRILQPLFEAMPKHETKGPVPDDESLMQFEKATWPDIKE